MTVPWPGIGAAYKLSLILYFVLALYWGIWYTLDMIKQVSEKQFNSFYEKRNKLSLPPITFEDVWNKSNSVIVRKIIQQKVIGFIVNWSKFYIVLGG